MNINHLNAFDIIMPATIPNSEEKDKRSKGKVSYINIILIFHPIRNVLTSEIKLHENNQTRTQK